MSTMLLHCWLMPTERISSAGEERQMKWYWLAIATVYFFVSYTIYREDVQQATLCILKAILCVQMGALVSRKDERPTA